MAFPALVSQNNLQSCSMVFTCCTISPPAHKAHHHKLHFGFSRRAGAIAIITSVILAAETSLNDETANSFEFRMTVPDQTVEEAESMIRDHAQALLDVKSFIESEHWREAQRELRKNAAYLKQDIYTIIQGKEGSNRPLLRKLYSNLFNNVSKLDYAAREKDAPLVQECYNNVAAALDDILSRI